MRCPNCAQATPYEYVQCPNCKATLRSADVEELDHLVYLAGRLVRWRREGAIPEGTATAALALTQTEIAEVQARLKLTPGPAPATIAPPSPVAPAPQVAPPAAAAPPVVAPPSIQPASAAVPPVAAAPGLPPVQPPPPRPVARRPFLNTLAASLLSERTLRTLLGLGVFLVLAAGAVISTVNPTGLPGLPLLLVVLVTGALFYGAGAMTHFLLKLTVTGAGLMVIGAGFVPLVVWRVGDPLNWSGNTIWLVASIVSLPVFAGSYALLRDRAFALLVALGGVSLTLAAAAQLGATPPQASPLLVAAMCVYLGLAAWRWTSQLARMLRWTAHVVVAATLLVVGGVTLVPLLFDVLGTVIVSRLGIFGDILGIALNDMAGEPPVAAAFWLGVVFYLLAARFDRSRFAGFAAAWIAPLALLLTLPDLPIPLTWHAVGLALLAFVYLMLPVRRRQTTPEGEIVFVRSRRLPAAVAAVPIVLSIAVWIWPFGSAQTETIAYAVLALGYFVATLWRRQRGWAYGFGILLAFVLGSAFRWNGWPAPWVTLAWAIAAFLLMLTAECVVWFTDDGQRNSYKTLIGWGRWNSPFGPPLFIAGHLAWWAALFSGLGTLIRFDVFGEFLVVRSEARTIVALFILVGIYLGLAASRRSSATLYVASLAFLVPYLAAVYEPYDRLNLPFAGDEIAQALAPLALVYWLIAFGLEWVGPRYTAPFHLGALGIGALAVLLTRSDRVAVLAAGALALVLAAEAGLHAWRRVSPLQFLFDHITGDLSKKDRGPAPNLFLYAAVWWLPVWLAFVFAWFRPNDPTPVFGVWLAGLGAIYIVAGWAFAHRRWSPPGAQWAWYSAGGFVLALGAVIAQFASPWDIAALVIVLALSVVAARLFRRPAWRYLTVLVAPFAIARAIAWFEWRHETLGPGLVALAALCLALAALAARADRLQASANPWSRPWLAGAYAWAGFGTLHAVLYDRIATYAAAGLATIAFGVAAVWFAERRHWYPALAALVVLYATALSGAAIPDAWRGVALLPLAGGLGLAAALGRRRAGPDGGRPFLVGAWATVAGIGLACFGEPAPSLLASGAVALTLILASLLQNGSPWPAWVSLGFGLIAFGQALRLVGVEARDQPAAWAAMGLVFAVVGVALRGRAVVATRAYHDPLSILSFVLIGLAALASIVVALFNSAMVPAVATTIALGGLALITHGVGLRRRTLSYLGAGAVLFALLIELFAYEVGQPQAFALPIGAFLLTVAALERGRGAGPLKDILETVGLLVLLSVSLLQAGGLFLDGASRYWYATGLIGESLVLLALGVALRWKKTLLAASLALVADALLLLVEPARAINPWYLLAAVGLAFVTLAVLVERQRQRIPNLLAGWRRRLDNWR